jgi:hypothetical protein
MTTDTRVRTRTLDWKEMVQRSWGKEWTKPEPAYEFSNDRKFEDNPNGGPYTPEQDE